jgi:hypothetical protein
MGGWVDRGLGRAGGWVSDLTRVQGVMRYGDKCARENAPCGTPLDPLVALPSIRSP